jgi:hypothetical protein
MAGAQKVPVQYRVIGSVAVIRKDKHEQYLPKHAVFGADLLDEDNAEHLLNVGLIEKVEPEPAAE